MTYYQECMFGEAVCVEVEQEYKPTQEEINNYYKTHTLLETVRHFHHRRPKKLNIDPELKKGRRGAGKRPSFNTEVQVVFLKMFTKKSDLALSKMVGVSNKTVAAIERRNKPLKNLFEEYMVQLGNACGEHLLKNKDMFLAGINDILTEAMSKKKIRAVGFKELINGWTKLHSNIMKYIPRNSVTENGDAAAKAQLMSAITDAIKSDEMDKATMESIYYQSFPIYAEIPNKKTLNAFAEVENGVNVKTYNTPEELWQEIEQ